MSVLIEDAETDMLLTRIREKTGESPAELVRHSLRERLERLSSEEVSERLRAIREIQDRVAAMPCLDARDPDEIIGYNEHGHFD